jgi:Protein of unknown function (DUF2721)
MDISINTPALLFPAISLIMLAYTNRFLALSSRIRQLHDKYLSQTNKHVIHGQIKNLRYRVRLIKNMQAFGVLTFIGCILSMYFIYVEWMLAANVIFAISLLCFVASLTLSFIEIAHSTKALDLELNDIEGLEDPTVLEYLKKKFDRDKAH